MTWNKSVVIECFVQCHCKKRKLLATQLNQAWHLSEVNAQKFNSVIASQMVSNLAAECVNYSASTHQRSWVHARKQKKSFTQLRIVYARKHFIRVISSVKRCHAYRYAHTHITLFNEKKAEITRKLASAVVHQRDFRQRAQAVNLFSGFTQLNA